MERLLDVTTVLSLALIVLVLVSVRRSHIPISSTWCTTWRRVHHLPLHAIEQGLFSIAPLSERHRSIAIKYPHRQHISYCLFTDKLAVQGLNHRSDIQLIVINESCCKLKSNRKDRST